jgi:hypothetical protein
VPAPRRAGRRAGRQAARRTARPAGRPGPGPPSRRRGRGGRRAAGGDVLLGLAVLLVARRQRLGTLRHGTRVLVAVLVVLPADGVEDLLADLGRRLGVVGERLGHGVLDAGLQRLDLVALRVALAQPQVALLVQGGEGGVLLGCALVDRRGVLQRLLHGREVLLGLGQVGARALQVAVGLELRLEGDPRRSSCSRRSTRVVTASTGSAGRCSSGRAYHCASSSAMASSCRFTEARASSACSAHSSGVAGTSPDGTGGWDSVTA